MGRNDPPGGATGGAKLKVVGSRRKYRSRSTSASSQDSMSSGSYSGESKDALITFFLLRPSMSESDSSIEVDT